MKEIPNFRGLLVILLAAVLVPFAALTAKETSYAAEQPDRITGIHRAYIYGYPDGTVKPLGVLTREEAAAIFSRLLEGCDKWAAEQKERKFSDVSPDRWSYREISELADAGFLQGYPDGSFRPENPITRAEFANIASKLSTKFDLDVPSFPDTPNHWGADPIRTAACRGWIRSFGDGSFRPEEHLLRCEGMMLINDALDRRVNGEGLTHKVIRWIDNPAHEWYYEIVQEASNSHKYERMDKTKSTERWIE
ncbi:S-layer homology domain-containing protein [Anoxybacterium hadale]|uniref:S-layer homology domain-containing protein n=1 Tax=Anoxybacterium hadale TaxID=3408580 RepID=A0ACD1A7Y8_9FIRM|nr:S-layer homology domain-containing protein [Clostridiales bacterium]